MKQKKKNTNYKAIVAVVVALAFVLPGSAAFANTNSLPGAPLANTSVSISPLMQDVDKGETFYVNISVEPGEPIMGVSVGSLSFNPALIHANSVTEGNLFAGHTTFFIAGTINNTVGTIIDIAVVTIPAAGVSNLGTFCRISFTAQNQSGTSALDLGGVEAAKYPSGTPAPVTVNDGQIVVIGPNNPL
jgi:hypothetical protein